LSDDVEVTAPETAQSQVQSDDQVDEAATTSGAGEESGETVYTV
jgi:hypothetical protein